MPGKSSRESAAQCLVFDERPATPKNIRKYRKSFFSTPGTRVTHPGMIEDREKFNELVANKRFGSSSDRSSAHLSDVFQGGPTGSLKDFVIERKERIYKTVQREPLGKPYKRGHNFESLGEQKKLASSSESAKDLIYSDFSSEVAMDPEDAVRIRNQYILSHQSYKPGERKQRNYKWGSLDPHEHRFGAVDMRPDEGVSYCLKQPDSLAEQKLDSNHQVAVASHRAMYTDQLGKAKFRGNLEQDYVDRLEQKLADRHTKNGNTFTAQDCIEGDYTVEQQLPDRDLGRAVRPGWRNTDTMRVFGASTVRTDKPAPKIRSVSDNQNYGDDTNAKTLLYPSPYVAAGVEDADFVDPTGRDDIRTIMENIGHDFTDDDFETMYRFACYCKTGVPDQDGPVVSIKEFLQVANDRFRSLDEGREPEWWNTV